MKFDLYLAAAAAVFGGAACSEPGSVEVTRSGSSAAPATWIANVSVFDGEKMLRAQDVVLRGAKIELVAPAGTATISKGATRIDGGGKTLLPGLVDAHTHFVEAHPPWHASKPNVEAIAQAYAYAGVTSQIVAQHDPSLFEFAAAAKRGEAVAPHLFLAGPGITAEGGHPIPLIETILPWPVNLLITRNIPQVKDDATARAAVRALHEVQRPTIMKIFYDDLPPGTPHLSKEALKAAIAEARALGIRPIVHTTLAAETIEAVDAGAALLMHTPFRDELTGEQAAHIARSGVPFVTTVRIFAAAGAASRGETRNFDAEMLDPSVLTAFKQRPEDYDPGAFAEMQKNFPNYDKIVRANFQKLLAAGATFFVGTDSGVAGSFPGAALHGELALLAELGVPPLRLLAAATSAPATWLDPQASFGRVAAGQRADLILVRGDPSADISALDELEEVFLEGDRLIRRRAAPR